MGAHGLVWDMTLSWNEWFRDATTLPRLRAAGYRVVGLTIGSDRGPDPRRTAEQGIAAVEQSIRQDPGAYLLVRTVQDVDRAVQEGRLGIELNFQGTGPLGGDVGLVRHFHDLGVRHMGLVWNDENPAGSSSTRGVDRGLTAYGRSLVREMNAAGVIVDGAHASYRTVMDAIAECSRPFIVSHGNVAALHDAYKNLQDDQVRACAATGGVVGISGLGSYLDDPRATPDALFRQVDHVAQRVGAAHVGLGLDYVTDIPRFWELVRQNPQVWPGPDGGAMPESGFFEPEWVHPLRELMEQAGYPAADVAGVLGGNWRRVAAACWTGPGEPQ